MSSVQSLIFQHPTNSVNNLDITSYTSKTWAKSYVPLRRYRLHTTMDMDSGEVTRVDFDTAFLPLMEDEEKRMSEIGQPPNARHWRFETEADIEHWWHTEVSDVVLAAWQRYPAIVQTDHTAPLGDKNIPENVDSTYAMYLGSSRAPVIIGEMKRNLIRVDAWCQGTVNEAQQRLAQELRGYADKYQCPQVFCWDGRTLLILQFRAQTASQIRNEDCEVDCWILPLNTGICTFRCALYRLMVQGLRRCQVGTPGPLTVGGFTETHREFFSGQPIWSLNGNPSYTHPDGYSRVVDKETGALGWVHSEQDPQGAWETGAIW
ncbi:hypothetical protein CEP52_015658 [Fusarium oligoseptatum]|uniref:Uncharacterized protein n=1 Tax=Fusarium oligoseptatum TaxID=2604345 RepID=A0A428SB25_9HYPO|nr:hypothetical protein CEP52_015658 [Fusarium oligoseptatum]